MKSVQVICYFEMLVILKYVTQYAKNFKVSYFYWGCPEHLAKIVILFSIFESQCIKLAMEFPLFDPHLECTAF